MLTFFNSPHGFSRSRSVFAKVCSGNLVNVPFRTLTESSNIAGARAMMLPKKRVVITESSIVKGAETKAKRPGTCANYKIKQGRNGKAARLIQHPIYLP